MKKKVLIIILILTLAFIWGQSMLPKSVSAAESGGMLAFLRPFLEIFVGEGNATDHLVRKIAHFVEYGALGAELALLIVAGWIANAKRKANEGATLTAEIMSLSIWARALIGLLFAFTVAAIDETIQIFSARGPGIADVLLDTAGAATAVLITTILCAIRKKDKL